MCGARVTAGRLVESGDRGRYNSVENKLLRHRSQAQNLAPAVDDIASAANCRLHILHLKTILSDFL